MIHATPFGYPPLTPAERHQDAAEACMDLEDAAVLAERFEEAPVRSEQKDAVQSIIGHCFDAKAEFDRTKDIRELSIGCSNATEVVMAQARYIGFVNQTISMVLAECRRLV